MSVPDYTGDLERSTLAYVSFRMEARAATGGDIA